jgi:selenocysteine lyase/cysteine desulfurase
MTTRRDFLTALGAASILGATDRPGGIPTRDLTDALLTQLHEGTSEYLMTPGLVYLNTGSTGPSTRAVLERTIAAWRELETNPVQQAYGDDGLLASAEKVRAQAAAFLGCSSDELLITRSTSEAMNTVAQSMRLTTGDRVLSTDQEHEGGTECWKYLAERRGVVLDVVAITGEMDDRGIVTAMAAAIRKETRVISVSHILWTTGRTMPVAAIAAMARDRGVLCVVDGAQAVGGMPVDVKALGCHAYATTGHKWLLAPKGLGLLYISADAAEAIKPVQWMRGKKFVAGSTGVGPLVLVAGLGAAIDAATARGLAEIERHNLALRNRAYAGLQKIKRARIMSGAPGGPISALVSFALPVDIPSRALMQTLSTKFAVQVKSFAAPFNGMRLSPHVFNTVSDIDRALHAIEQEVQSA